jgi:uncharacterized protein (DUF1697 family)
MKYVALLRGINVGGKNIIKMAVLKEAFEKSGFKNVSTYIQSGNVIFESIENNSDNISQNLEISLTKYLKVNLRIIVVPQDDLKKVVAEVPADWGKRKDLRCYIAFVKNKISAKDVLSEIKLKEGVDFVKVGSTVLYMTTLLSGLTKSGFTKLVGTKIYKDITIRNFNTVKSLLEIMEK